MRGLEADRIVVEVARLILASICLEGCVGRAKVGGIERVLIDVEDTSRQAHRSLT